MLTHLLVADKHGIPCCPTCEETEAGKYFDLCLPFFLQTSQKATKPCDRPIKPCTVYTVQDVFPDTAYHKQHNLFPAER